MPLKELRKIAVIHHLSPKAIEEIEAYFLLVTESQSTTIREKISMLQTMAQSSMSPTEQLDHLASDEKYEYLGTIGKGGMGEVR